MNKIKIFTDGGARGNPGPSGIGVVIEAGGAKKTYREFIGYATNNEAEYKALLFALQKVKLLYGKTKTKLLSLDCFLDSELVVKQLNHEYKINEENIQKFFLQIWNLSIDFREVKYTHIPREKNTEADRLANLALDEATRAQSRMF
ncbi:MAG TPA: ribonuclease HI family protein [Candidatus Bathyarchaeia archaeon]|nr:ribonuclease HI family protein [Candidatus Bathyarchaeia archaeon]